MSGKSMMKVGGLWGIGEGVKGKGFIEGIPSINYKVVDANDKKEKDLKSFPIFVESLKLVNQVRQIQFILSNIAGTKKQIEQLPERKEGDGLTSFTPLPTTESLIDESKITYQQLIALAKMTMTIKETEVTVISESDTKNFTNYLTSKIIPGMSSITISRDAIITYINKKIKYYNVFSEPNGLVQIHSFTLLLNLYKSIPEGSILLLTDYNTKKDRGEAYALTPQGKIYNFIINKMVNTGTFMKTEYVADWDTKAKKLTFKPLSNMPNMPKMSFNNTRKNNDDEEIVGEEPAKTGGRRTRKYKKNRC